LRQELLAAGFSTELISVDRSPDPYIEFKSSIYQDRILLPRHDLLKDELKGLIWDGWKVDHASNGSKDISDACAGVVQNMKNNAGRYMIFSDDFSRSTAIGREFIVE